MSDRVGVRVECSVCHRTKCPRGRSQPIGASFCDRDCAGWDQDPKVGDLWPGESAKDFGYPVCEAGTKVVEQDALFDAKPETGYRE